MVHPIYGQGQIVLFLQLEPFLQFCWIAKILLAISRSKQRDNVQTTVLKYCQTDKCASICESLIEKWDCLMVTPAAKQSSLVTLPIMNWQPIWNEENNQLLLALNLFAFCLVIRCQYFSCQIDIKLMQFIVGDSFRIIGCKISSKCPACFQTSHHSP